MVMTTTTVENLFDLPGRCWDTTFFGVGWAKHFSRERGSFADVRLSGVLALDSAHVTPSVVQTATSYIIYAVCEELTQRACADCCRKRLSRKREMYLFRPRKNLLGALQ